MIIHYNILSGDTKIKGFIGEIIASNCLKKMGFIVFRPTRILSFLKEMNVPNNYEVQFLRRYQKTMDYFAILPGTEPFLSRRQVVFRLFNGGGLNRYMGFEDCGHRGFVVEVKSKSDGKKAELSRRQKKMFRHAKKVGFEVIFPIVTFKDNYFVEIELGEDQIQ